jgi:predicted nucleic acid-binding protein
MINCQTNARTPRAGSVNFTCCIRAIDIAEMAQLMFWDALIVASAVVALEKEPYR